MAILQRLYSKAKWSQMHAYTGTEPQNTKNIQKLPFKSIRVVPCRNLLKNTLNIRKMTLKSAIVKQSGQKRFKVGPHVGTVLQEHVSATCSRDKIVLSAH